MYTFFSSLFQLQNQEMLLNKEVLEKERLRKVYIDRFAAEKERLKEQGDEFKVR
jgi:uncharacterized protein YnzC (UPF0291/DUF896 family)